MVRITSDYLGSLRGVSGDFGWRLIDEGLRIFQSSDGLGWLLIGWPVRRVRATVADRKLLSG